MKEQISAVITLTDGTQLTLTNDNIYNNFSISRQCVSGSGFELGGVCAATLDTSIYLEGISAYNLIGAVISVSVSQNGGDYVQQGVFNITSATRKRDIITLSAVDNMIYLDTSAYKTDENSRKVNLIASQLTTMKTPHEALKIIVEDVGGQILAQSQAEIEAMPNGTANTIIFDEIVTDCPRDWLSWIAEYLCGFAYADEYGKIAIKQFETTPTATISSSDIEYDTTDIAEFTIEIVGIKMDEVWDGSSGAVWSPEALKQLNSVYFDWSDNQFVQGHHYLYGTAMDLLETGADTICAIPCRPFRATCHTSEIYKMGQCINIQGLDGKYYQSIITHSTYKLHGGQQIKCVGEDTRILSQAKNRTAIKKTAEMLETKIKKAMGVDTTQADFDALANSGKAVEGQTYYIIEDTQ